jgi:hypothetical protein
VNEERLYLLYSRKRVREEGISAKERRGEFCCVDLGELLSTESSAYFFLIGKK